MQDINTKWVVEYLHFLLSEISRIKLDWEISEDEIELFNNELSRFKKIAVESENLSPGVIKMINKLELIKSTKHIQFRLRFKFNSSHDSERDRLNNLRAKQNIESLEEDLKRILNQIQYLSGNLGE